MLLFGRSLNDIWRLVRTRIDPDYVQRCFAGLLLLQIRIDRDLVVIRSGAFIAGFIPRNLVARIDPDFIVGGGGGGGFHDLVGGCNCHEGK